MAQLPPPHFYKLFLKYNFKICCIDPISSPDYSFYKKKHINIFNYFKGVISNTNKPIYFYLVEGTDHVISSIYNPEIIRSINKKSIKLIKVKSLTWNKFLKTKKIRNIFFLKIDTEGAEFHVTEKINKKIAPDILLIEYQRENQNQYKRLKRSIALLFNKAIYVDSLFINRMSRNNTTIFYNKHYKILANNTHEGSFFLFKKNILTKEKILLLKKILSFKKKKRIFV